MSAVAKRNADKLKAWEDARKEKYFDANTLELSSCQKEIRNMKGTGFVAVTSFLAIGEVIGNKINHDEEEISIKNFIDHIMNMRNERCLRLFSAENTKTEVLKILEMTSLDIADAQHLALAVRRKCIKLVSCDSDFTGIPCEMIQKIKDEFHLEEFDIEKRQLEKRR